MPITVVSINVSSGGIPKLPLDSVEITFDGITGDAHNHEKHNTPQQALCLFDMDGIEELKAEGYDIAPGTLGENLTLNGIDVDALQIGDRLRFTGGVEIEITKRRKPCYVLDAIDVNLKKAMVERAGVYAKVLAPGRMQPGERVVVVRGAVLSK